MKNRFFLSSLVDEEYLVLAGHIDANTRLKIETGEYVDLSKLLPRDKVIVEEDQRMQMIVKNGMTYWVPHHDGPSINSFSRWEQAFRVFSDIYVRAHPNRVAELIQYSHIINSISAQYHWDNVYNYDKDFRLHMARYPDRSWSLILHQAWAMRLRERVNSNNNSQNYSGPGKNGKRNNEVCRRFNRGRCTFGTNCKYEHRCLYCNKYGHPIMHCRKAQADKVESVSTVPGGATAVKSATQTQNNMHGRNNQDRKAQSLKKF